MLDLESLIYGQYEKWRSKKKIQIQCLGGKCAMSGKFNFPSLLSPFIWPKLSLLQEKIEEPRAAFHLLKKSFLRHLWLSYDFFILVTQKGSKNIFHWTTFQHPIWSPFYQIQYPPTIFKCTIHIACIYRFNWNLQNWIQRCRIWIQFKRQFDLEFSI